MMTIQPAQVGVPSRRNAANAVIKRTWHASDGALRLPIPHRSGPTLNRLLAVLPPEEWQCGYAKLEWTDMPLGTALARTGEDPGFVYFPTTAVVSLQQTMADGSVAEIAAVGNDGVVGVSLFMGARSTLLQAVVRCAGQGYRFNGAAMRQIFERSAQARRVLLLYTQALITQMAQACACNRHHSIDQQLCRFFLGTMDRTRSSELCMTHELIASSLGVRREGVTAAALRLQKAGILERSARGHLKILDRRGMEDRVCECYSIVTKECQRLQRDPTGMRIGRAGPATDPCTHQTA